jgi:hypothetical protein
MVSTGIELATLRLVAKCLNKLRYRVPWLLNVRMTIIAETSEMIKKIN